MDIYQFETEARADAEVNAFLEEVAREAEAHAPLEIPERFGVGPVEVTLLSMAVYTFFRWAKNLFDFQRARQEVTVAQQQEQLIAALIADGFPPKQAQAVATTLLNNIAKRTTDDPVLKRALALIDKGAK